MALRLPVDAVNPKHVLEHLVVECQFHVQLLLVEALESRTNVVLQLLA
jgi:hypothetical protein